jgi:hypothetical protein
MKRNDSRALSRIKRVYNSCTGWYVHKFKRGCNKDAFGNFKKCESITEFLDMSKYAKLLKKTTVPFRSKMRQLEHKYENRKFRHNAKKQIEQEINEYSQELTD